MNYYKYKQDNSRSWYINDKGHGQKRGVQYSKRKLGGRSKQKIYKKRFHSVNRKKVKDLLSIRKRSCIFVSDTDIKCVQESFFYRWWIKC